MTTAYVATRQAWRDMKNRCDNPNHRQYKHYGGRGISYCERWKLFENFLADMGIKSWSVEGSSLDRIDNDGNYEPANCRWATSREQILNQRMKHTNKSGIAGVHYHERDALWYARVRLGNGVRKLLYCGKDFFEACCAQKSFESSLS